MSGADTSAAKASGHPPALVAGIRRGVRNLLEGTEVFGALPAEQRRALAEGLVNVGVMAAKLSHDDRQLTERARRGRTPPMAQAQDAGNQLGMQAVHSAAGTIRAMRDSIDFPAFVTSLISSVFQAILSSSTYQMGSLVDLLDNVSATSDEFNATLDDGEARRWAVAKFSFLSLTGGQLALRSGVEDLSAYAEQLKSGLAASDDEVGGIDAEDLEGTLLPLAKRKMGRDKQGILATMVQMGLQRIVVDEGRLHASMDLRVDASSASQEDLMQRDDWRLNAGASASAAYGPFSASASVSTSVGKVHSDNQYTSEQLGVRAGLRSSVELAFRTEQVPLDRLADEKARVRIGQNARVPVDVGGQSTLQTLPNIAAPSLGEVPPVPAAPAAPPLRTTTTTQTPQHPATPTGGNAANVQHPQTTQGGATGASGQNPQTTQGGGAGANAQHSQTPQGGTPGANPQPQPQPQGGTPGANPQQQTPQGGTGGANAQPQTPGSANPRPVGSGAQTPAAGT